MYVKIDGHSKPVERIDLTSVLANTLIHTKTEAGTEETYNQHSDSPKWYPLRNLLSSDVYIQVTIIC